MDAAKLAAVVFACFGGMSFAACEDTSPRPAPVLVSAVGSGVDSGAGSARLVPAGSASAPAIDAGRADAVGAAEFDVWRERLPLEVSESACRSQLRALAAHDPILLLVLAHQRRKKFGRFEGACASDAAVSDALRTAGASARALDALREPARFRFGAEISWEDAAREIAGHSEALFAPSDADALISLLASPRFTDDRLRSGLLVGVAKGVPGRRELYRDWAPRLLRPDPRFARAYLAELPLEGIPAAWLDKTEIGCNEEVLARAVFESVRRADPTALSALQRLVATRPADFHDRPIAFGYLIDAVVRLGAPKRAFACREALPQRCIMTSVEMGKQRAAAVEACLTVARTWLATRVP